MSAPEKRRSSKAGIFLLETIIAVLFFSLASAVCIQLFANAHRTHLDSKDLGMAMHAAQSAAEHYRAGDGSPETLAGALGGVAEDGVVTVYYDDDWALSSNGDRVMTIRAADGTPPSARITLSRGGEPIYELTVKRPG